MPAGAVGGSGTASGRIATRAATVVAGPRLASLRHLAGRGAGRGPPSPLDFGLDERGELLQPAELLGGELVRLAVDEAQGAGRPAAGAAERRPDGEESLGRAGGGRHERWEVLGDEAARAAQLPADEVLHQAWEAHSARAPGELRQVALRAAVA